MLLVPVYRHLAQHAPDTRIAPVPGDVLFLEIAITDTCRFFSGLHGADSYAGIVETGPFLESLQKLSKQFGDDATAESYKDLLSKRDELDAQGYGRFKSQGFFSLLPSGWRRIFNGDWFASSSEKATLEKVTPHLKVETASRPATIRLRIDDMRAVQAAKARLTSSPQQSIVPDAFAPWNSILPPTVNVCSPTGRST